MTIDSIITWFYGIFQRCVMFLTTQTFGLPFPIGYLFLVLFVLGLVIKYLTMLAN